MCRKAGDASERTICGSEISRLACCATESRLKSAIEQTRIIRRMSFIRPPSSVVAQIIRLLWQTQMAKKSQRVHSINVQKMDKAWFVWITSKHLGSAQ